MAKQSSNARKRARKKALQQTKQEHKSFAETPKEKNDEKISTTPSKSHKRKHPQHEDKEEDDLLAIAAAWATQKAPPAPAPTMNKKAKKATGPATKSLKQVTRKPPKFPKDLPAPASGFLKNEEPYKKSFETALSTAYEGCIWDGPTAQESELQKALTTMDECGLFRTDVTQPAGLGAKLVPSYVTRCLLGEEGTTYRYLGLRMFSHPWNGIGQAKRKPITSKTKQNSKQSTKELQQAIQTFQALNQRLSERTKSHLQDLQSKRQERHEEEPVIQGQSTHNVTLINKMTVHKKLRDEPMFGTNKYSVGWHADSSLEHFSSIAVYQTILQKNPSIPQGDWSVALRVSHDAEGPCAKRLGDIAVQEESPPIQVELPSGSTYYLLDDFNHHHQHAVLAPPDLSAMSVRFSSTHRLLRQGHNVQDIIARCKTTCDNFHRHGTKRWRSEQLLLTELENEWLRQFFIQGPFHKTIHWGYWERPIVGLFEYWEKLEARTRQVLLILKHASEERCGHSSIQGKESLATVDQVKGDRSPKEGIYNSLALLLSERAKSRDLWAKRERDPVFKRLSPDCHPIPFPVSYGSLETSGNAMATSPMPDGSSAFLTQLASNIKAWGAAFESGSAKSLPTKVLLESG
jgi:alpha-ketoglutarate-dependent dioxygenase FTO